MDTIRPMTAARQERFEALLASHLGILFRVVQTYSRQPDDQQDLAQEIRLQLWRAFAKYDERRQFSTWMYRIALNVAISWTRHTSFRSRRSVPLTDVADFAETPSPDENLHALHQLIDRLDPLNRALLLLYLEDLSTAEIGEVLGITPGNVATKISRLKQLLREQVNQKDNE